MNNLDKDEIEVIIWMIDNKVDDIEKFESLPNDEKWKRAIVKSYLLQLKSKLERADSE